MDVMNEKLQPYIKKYQEKFEDFPSYQLMNYSDSEVIRMIKKCLDKGKDMYELGILEDDASVFY